MPGGASRWPHCDQGHSYDPLIPLDLTCTHHTLRHTIFPTPGLPGTMLACEEVRQASRWACCGYFCAQSVAKSLGLVERHEQMPTGCPPHSAATPTIAAVLLHTGWAPPPAWPVAPSTSFFGAPRPPRRRRRAICGSRPRSRLLPRSRCVGACVVAAAAPCRRAAIGRVACGEVASASWAHLAARATPRV